MSSNKPNTKPAAEANPAPTKTGAGEAETQHAVAESASSHNISLAEIRKECIKLAHSAAKGVDEVLAEAAIYTHWVQTGKRLSHDEVIAGLGESPRT